MKCDSPVKRARCHSLCPVRPGGVAYGLHRPVIHDAQSVAALQILVELDAIDVGHVVRDDH